MPEFRRIVKRNLNSCSLLKEVLPLEERRIISEELDESIELLEVNQERVNQLNYLSDELVELIKIALDKEALKPLPYKINNEPVQEILIDDKTKNFPRIYATVLHGKVGEYEGHVNSIFLDLLNDKGEISNAKKSYFLDGLAPFVVSHELAHSDHLNTLTNLGKRNIFFTKNRDYVNDKEELHAFKQQLTKMTDYYFVKTLQEVLHNHKYDRSITMNQMFSETVNKLITSIFTNNSLSKPFLDNLSEQNKKECYKYIYSQAKEMFLDNYRLYETWLYTTKELGML